VVRHGETLESVLRGAGVARDQITGIFAAFGIPLGHAAVAEGARLKLLFADLDGSGTNMTLARLSVYSGETWKQTSRINDHGSYVQVTRPIARPAAEPSESDDADDEAGMRLYDSLYETALKQEIPRPVVDELVRIFANDVDFGRAVSGGDSSSIL